MNYNKNTAAQPLDLSKLPRVFGVSRDAESPGGKAVLVTFHRALTDDELRTFHDGLTAKARASQPEGATGTTGAIQSDDDELMAFPTQPEELHARWKCEDCEGRGHDGEAHWQGHFQPPEPAKCSACNGSGWVDVVALLPEQVIEAQRKARDYQKKVDWKIIDRRDAEIADLRAQLAAKGQGEPVAEVTEGYMGPYRAAKVFRKTDVKPGDKLYRAAPASAQPDRGAALAEPVQVKIERQRVWIVKGNRSFMLAYVPDEGDDPAEMEAYASNLRSALSIFTPDVKSGVAAPSPASQPVAPEAAPTDLAKVGYFIREGAAWVATSSDDPRATILYRKTGAENAAPTTVPDHSERGAANAKVHGPKTLMTDEQAFNWAWTELKKDLGAERWNAGDEVQSWAFFKYGWDHRTQLELQRYKAPATIAAGQEAANAKDAALADVLNTTLWLYRRLPQAYGNPLFVDKAILVMAERLGLDDVPAAIKERAAMAAAPSSEKGGANHG